MANLKQIEKHLERLKLPYKIVDLGKEIFTVRGIVESGVNENEVLKTLIVHSPSYTNFGRSSQNVPFTALVVRGKDRLDFNKVRKLFGSEAELAKPDEVLKVCGVPVGAVCSILVGAPVFFDKKVMNLSHVNMGSGDLMKGLEMDLADLLKAVGNYQVEDLV